MLLSEVKTIELLPKLFKSDTTAKGMAAAADYLLQLFLTNAAPLPLWTQINSLAETYLDEMADALNLKWYDKGASLLQKAAIINSAEQVYRRLGTPDAVEQVARDYFGAAVVEEWYEYSGTPGHFRIKIQAQNITQAQIDAFSVAIRYVKRLSAHLDAITIENPIQGILNVAGAYQDSQIIQL